MTVDLALVTPWPPARTGVAAYAARLVPHLARRARVTVYTDETAPSPDAAARRPLDELGRHDHDLILYQVGNSRANAPALHAAAVGPPGAVLLHDGSLHHLIGQLAPDTATYAEQMALAHGEAGRRLAELRSAGIGGEADLVLYDGLAPLLRRHRLVITHSRGLAELVRRRVPELAVLPLFHPAPRPPTDLLDRSELGLPTDRPLIGSAGFLAPNKRPDVLVAALDRLIEQGRDPALVILGADLTSGLLAALLESHPRVAERTLVTGYLSELELWSGIAALDASVSLRAHHLGEASGPTLQAMAVGTPVVCQPIGSWRELEQVAFATPGGDEADALARALASLLDRGPDEAAAARARLAAWTAEHLDPDEQAERLMTALVEAPPAPASPGPVGPVLATRPFAPRPEPRAAWGYRFVRADGGLISFGSGASRGRIDIDGTVLAAAEHEGTLTLVTERSIQRIGLRGETRVSPVPAGLRAATINEGQLWLLDAAGELIAPDGQRRLLPDAASAQLLAVDAQGRARWASADGRRGGDGLETCQLPGSTELVALIALVDRTVVVRADTSVDDLDGITLQHRELTHPHRVVAACPTPDRRALWMLTSTGAVFGFGPAPYRGGLSRPPTAELVAMVSYTA